MTLPCYMWKFYLTMMNTHCISTVISTVYSSTVISTVYSVASCNPESVLANSSSFIMSGWSSVAIPRANCSWFPSSPPSFNSRLMKDRKRWPNIKAGGPRPPLPPLPPPLQLPLQHLALTREDLMTVAKYPSSSSSSSTTTSVSTSGARTWRSCRESTHWF